MNAAIVVAKTLAVHECGHDEYWLQQMIAHNPAILGLGDLSRLLKKPPFEIRRKLYGKMTLRNRPRIEDLDQVEAQASPNFGRFFALPTFSAAC